MNHSKLYVPDPNLWINFFKRTSHKKVINQKGGKNMLSAKQSTEPMNVELISPVEAAHERTQSAIKRIRKKTKPSHKRRRRINRRTNSGSSRKRKVSRSKKRRTVKRKRKTRKNKRVKIARDIFSK